MNTTISRYLSDLQRELSSGQAQEHSYRPALKSLFESITGLNVVNEPKGSAHGRPDFIFLKGDVPLAWVEAKDLHVNLEKIEQGEQMARYFGYANLILTNGLEFRFYKNGQKYGDAIALAEKHGSTLAPQPEAFDHFARTLADFVEKPMETIKSAEHLAKIMGGKARRLRENVFAMLDPSFRGERGDVDVLMQVLKRKLIHDLTPEQFADLYAQTLVYGLFVARYNDDTPETFTRIEARDRIPASNHLLQQFFDHIAGANFVKKLSYIVDELCDVFVHANVHDLVHGLYRKDGDTHDPIIHFYEDFLKEYDPELRAQRGVFYTPLPVVRYIVRSVDALLKEHFGLPEGLADRQSIEWKFTEQGKTSKRAIDRVQVLDPAVGTGTFLNEVIRHVHTQFQHQQGMWPDYVSRHLIPRLHGFELMMASYTIAHLKLSMTLAETGVEKLDKRLRVFLTNSLEEAPPKDDTLFRELGMQGALTEEAIAAEEVKRDLPIMVVMGNPPYSISSQNASVEIGTDGKKRKTWIGALLDEYKKDLHEKKLNLDDDYIKFIRFSHHLIEKNGQGIVAMITNNSFLDGITHRRMRQSLMETFDHIYVLDLHGNSKRKEVSPDGTKDENVFDIQQGVGITLFVRTSAKKKTLGAVHHMDLYGKRLSKYEWLDAHDVSSTPWQELTAPEPNYFFVPKDFQLKEEYEKFISVSEIFCEGNAGIQTKRDSLVYSFTPQELAIKIDDLARLNRSEIFQKYDLQADNDGWKLQNAIDDLNSSEQISTQALYRPFDLRWTIYTGKSSGFMARPRAPLMMSMLQLNIGLLCVRNSRRGNVTCFFVANKVSDKDSVSPFDNATLFPLYLYSFDGSRIPNLKIDLLAPVLARLQLEWVTNGTGDGKVTCGPEDILDYIYAVLHSPTYRERYKEFLKIDFPRVPFTADAELFWKLVHLGRELRQLHLMESPVLQSLITTYPVAGSNVVEKISYDAASKCVFINAAQYFSGVPEDVWNFPIGGYQPLQKWLKDRKGRTLTSDDLLHWQKIVVALKETGRVMGEVDREVQQFLPHI